ncbi:gamma-glutamylcyclotransferase family protein [Mucilaginibacter psychrotolerans]|uniref:Gamma-glutamylcyclotransferase n=1 Tax=Mucilaginibacter psychrotolerans TaxID=1524096 RepID=A0A4Y8SM03_9SPHI|nr:gamma-glutamylcyclotransferase family protein [Mucilaginibacter psychrotolerans]TFF39587.1 gamma-glutamylcyclotransferase [Mucilaginibacter psychrotolerans]
MPTHLLFVYGTLLQKDNEFGIYLKKHCAFLSAGKIKGRLYDIGEYPGLMFDAAGYFIHGNIYSVDTDDVLQVLDAYEGVGPLEDQPNLYQRINCPIVTNDGDKNAWVYVYNLPVEGSPEITSGNYLEYIGQKKSPGS